MEVEFTPEQLASLSQIASYHGTDAAQLVKDVTLRAVEEDRRFLEAVERGIEQAERGEFIEEQEMDARVARMLQP
jgi:predicted transcriptional regulator